jgi:hypothetical protein
VSARRATERRSRCAVLRGRASCRRHVPSVNIGTTTTRPKTCWATAKTTATTTSPSRAQDRRTCAARAQVRTLLSALAALSGVQLAASVDHINAPLLWTSTELLAQRWLWHDMTTLAAYGVELAGADPASLRGAPTTTTAAVSMRARAESMGMGGGAWSRSRPHWHQLQHQVGVLACMVSQLTHRRLCASTSLLRFE